MKADHPTPEAYEHAAWLLRCDAAALRAVAAVEAGQHGAFLATEEPVILFERHLFHRLTQGRFDGALASGVRAETALISAPSPGGYGAVSEQHAKLRAAVALARDPALRSCSWGLFQILGLNHQNAGYPQLARFITAMYRSADDHLRALVQFIRADGRLVDAIREHDWAAFAFAYNGPQYARHGYDRRMAEAFAKEAA